MRFVGSALISAVVVLFGRNACGAVQDASESDLGEIGGYVTWAGEGFEEPDVLASGNVMLVFTAEGGQEVRAPVDYYGFYNLSLPAGRYCVSGTTRAEALKLFEFYRPERCIDVAPGERQEFNLTFLQPGSSLDPMQAYPGTIRRFIDGRVELESGAVSNLAGAPIGTGLERGSRFARELEFSVKIDDAVAEATGLTDEAVREHVGERLRAAGIEPFGEGLDPSDVPLSVSLEGVDDVVLVAVEYAREVEYIQAVPGAGNSLDPPVRVFRVLSAPTWRRRQLIQLDQNDEVVLRELDALIDEFLSDYDRSIVRP